MTIQTGAHMTTTTTTISTNVNAVAPTALHRALKNPAVEMIQSVSNAAISTQVMLEFFSLLTRKLLV